MTTSPHAKESGNGLTPKQEAFARFYIETGNASEAYRKAYDAAGMKDETIHVKASELLKNGKVAVRLAELQEEVARRHNVTVDRIVGELAKIGFANMLDYVTVGNDGSAYVDLSALTRDQAAAIQEVVVEHLPARTMDSDDGEMGKVQVLKTKFKLADKRAALVDLGKHLGMFPNKHEVTGADGQPLMPEASPRELARAIVDILRTAPLADSETDDEPYEELAGPNDYGSLTGELGGAPPQSAVSSSDAILRRAPPDTAPPPPAMTAQDQRQSAIQLGPGERLLLDSGAWILNDAEFNRFAVFDSNGRLHGYRRDFAAAQQLARAIPPEAPK